METQPTGIPPVEGVAICFTQGHKEKLVIEDVQHEGLVDMLFRSGYKLGKIETWVSWTELHTKNYQVIVVGSPEEPFRESEIEEIHDFVKDGGSLFVLADAGGDAIVDSNLNQLCKPFGFSFNDDILFDETLYHEKPDYPKINNLQKHFITRGVSQFVYASGCSLEMHDDKSLVLAKASPNARHKRYHAIEELVEDEAEENEVEASEELAKEEGAKEIEEDPREDDIEELEEDRAKEEGENKEEALIEESATSEEEKSSEEGPPVQKSGWEEETSLAGPVPVLVARKYKKGKVVAIGNYSIITSLSSKYGLYALDNFTLIGNIFAWLTNKKKSGQDKSSYVYMNVALDHDLYFWIERELKKQRFHDLNDLVNFSINALKEGLELRDETEK